jgi:hypothetical protein
LKLDESEDEKKRKEELKEKFEGRARSSRRCWATRLRR